MSQNYKQDTYCDFASSEFDDNLRAIDGNLLVSKARLLQFIAQRVKSRILQIHPDWTDTEVLHPTALQQLVDINMRIDCTRNLQVLASEFLVYQAQVDLATREQESAKRKFLFNSSASTNDVEQEIDKRSYRGGQTKLHVEACNNNLVEVKRLVEVERARTDIKDNHGKTAYEYAYWMGHAEIADYLRNFR